jgi:hypothetical protein
MSKATWVKSIIGLAIAVPLFAACGHDATPTTHHATTSHHTPAVQTVPVMPHGYLSGHDYGSDGGVTGGYNNPFAQQVPDPGVNQYSGSTSGNGTTPGLDQVPDPGTILSPGGGAPEAPQFDGDLGQINSMLSNGA